MKVVQALIAILVVTSVQSAWGAELTTSATCGGDMKARVYDIEIVQITMQGSKGLFIGTKGRQGSLVIPLKAFQGLEVVTVARALADDAANIQVFCRTGDPSDIESIGLVFRVFKPAK